MKNPSDPADEPSGFSKRNGHRRVERIVRTEQERVTVKKHPLDDDAFKRHGHREDAAAGRPDAGGVAVSYTHLDVYKRQLLNRLRGG